jgi:hypothetical protein
VGLLTAGGKTWLAIVLYQGTTSHASEKVFDRVELPFRPASKSSIYEHSERALAREEKGEVFRNLFSRAVSYWKCLGL